MRKFQLEDGREVAAKAREALRAVERFVEPQIGTAGAMAIAPGKATLTQGLQAATPSPVDQLHRMATRFAVEVENLEQANRCGELSRALSARAELERFLSQAPYWLAALTPRAANEFKDLMQEFVERAAVALENGPNISRAATDAARRRDYRQWDADLAPWRAKVDPVASAESARKTQAATEERQAARRQATRNFIRLIGGSGVDTSTHAVAKGNTQPVAAPTATTRPQSASPSTIGVEAEEDHIAARGTQGAGGPLPHLDTIQAAFGHHDVSSVRAHVGGKAADASDALGAQAYAYGDAIAFASAPDLHTAAHEAAHVVQQRRGVSRGLGMTAAHERHADLVADGVVAGRSVEALLNTMAGGGGRTAVVQRKPVYGAARAGVTPQAPSPAGATHLYPKLLEIEQAMQHCTQIRELLLPAYRHAVDALDATTAREFAGSVVASIRAALTAQTRAKAAIKSESRAATFEAPISLSGAPPEAAKQPHDQLVAEARKLDQELADLTAILAVQLGPQTYKGTLILGKLEHPHLGKNPAHHLSNEAMTMVALLDAVHQARAIAGATDATCTALNDNQKKKIAALIEPWHSRPINYAFMVQALRDIGLWDNLAAAKGPSGNTLSSTANKSMAQALRIGRTADVGEFDSDEAARILTGLRNDQRWRPDAFGGPLPDRDTSARTIYQRILSATPEARGPIVRELHTMGTLGFLCDHL